MMMKKNNKFTVAPNGYIKDGKRGIHVPSSQQLNKPWGFASVGAPRVGWSDTNTIRYMALGKNRFLCEEWATYEPKTRGKFGRQRSVLRARYEVIRIRDKGRKSYSYLHDGNMESYYWSGRVYKRAKHEDDRMIYCATFDADGRLSELEDTTRGEFDRRLVRIADEGDERIIKEWRGRYRHVTRANRWNAGWTETVRATEDGTPLLDNANFLECERSNEGKLIREVRFVGGRKHGIEKHYNKSGRCIQEEYFHHGIDIPGWVFRSPESVTIAEILEENNAEVRRAMLELQGFEVFLSRAEAAGMVEVVDQDPDDKVGTLLRIELEDIEKGGRFTDSADDRVAMLLKVKDGTLPKSYVLRVPPNMKTARQANAWTWGLKESEYAPAIER
jgi:hypothetical protein